MDSKDYGKTFFISVILVLLIFQAVPDFVIADDHKNNKRLFKRYENSKEHRDYDDHGRRRVKKDDEGNETTGQTAAWLLAAANLTVFLGVILKFKLFAKGMRKIVYRLHTTSASFLIMILLLVVGHLIVD